MAKDWTKIYKKYKGLWVALDSDEETVLGFGKTVKSALIAAKAKSERSPILTRMPKELESYVGRI